MWLGTCFDEGTSTIRYLHKFIKLYARTPHLTFDWKYVFTCSLIVYLTISLSTQQCLSQHTYRIPAAGDTTSSWFWQNPFPQGNDLYSISSLDTLSAIAVGAAGTVLYTTDGGTTWKMQHSLFNTRSVLRSVQFLDSNTAWTVGDSSKIFSSSDGGKNWIRHEASGASIRLNSVHFVTRQLGFMAGEDGAMFKTTTGGASWDLRSLFPYKNLNALNFISPSQGWACGDSGTLLLTSNGGTRWDSVVVCQNCQNVNFYDIMFRNNTLGWVVGAYGRVFRTSNGGTSWDFKTSGALNIVLTSVNFVDTSNGIAVGKSGRDTNVIVSSNGGDTWTSSLVDTISINSISLTSAFTGWAVGDKGRVWKVSSNPSLTFSSLTQGVDNMFVDVHIFDYSTAIVIGDQGKMMATTDGGDTWTPRVTSTTIDLNAIDFWNASLGCAVGNATKIILTTDRGATWFDPYTGAVGGALHAVKFLDSAHVVAVGDTGAMLTSVDGGLSWQPITFDSRITLRSLTNVPSNGVWASGDSSGIGKIYHSTDFGVTWQGTSMQPTLQLNSIYFPSSTIGWAVGNSATIRRTTNSGVTWVSRPRPFPFGSPYYQTKLNTVYFISDSLGWIAGDNGVILKTTNGGQSWQLLLSNCDKHLNAISFLDASTGWAVGSGGTILKTVRGGGSAYPIYPLPAKKTPPDVDSIYNRPNPIRGSTSFYAKIAKTTSGTTKIYDILGRFINEFSFQVTTTFTAWYNVGTWNGNDNNGLKVPSGVYFYVITTPTTNVTGKMVFLK